MNQVDWIVLLTITITAVPLIKMGKDKRFSLYNIFIVITGAAVLWVTISKNHKDIGVNIEKERLSHISDSTNKSEIKKIGNQVNISQDSLKKLRIQLDSIGLGVDSNTGKLLIWDSQILKKFIFNHKPSINVTSINQKGGQTAGSITNNK